MRSSDGARRGCRLRFSSARQSFGSSAAPESAPTTSTFRQRLQLGIAIINAPAGNTVAVAELFFGTLYRTGSPSACAQSNRCAKADGIEAQLLGTELRGRSLGIIGLGRIGSEVALRARAFGMSLVAYDPYVTDERFDLLRVSRAKTLEELLPRCRRRHSAHAAQSGNEGHDRRDEIAILQSGAIVANHGSRRNRRREARSSTRLRAEATRRGDSRRLHVRSHSVLTSRLAHTRPTSY